MTVFLLSGEVETGTGMHCFHVLFCFLASKPLQTSTKTHTAFSEQVQELQLSQAYPQGPQENVHE